MFTLEQQRLVRTWIRGVPLATLETKDIFTQLAGLRAALYLKACRLQHPSAELWLKRQTSPSWEISLLNSFDALLQLPDLAPEPKQRLVLWFTPRIAASLTAAGLTTLQDLLDVIQQQGKSWWQSIPGIGWSAARHIEANLSQLWPEHLLFSPAFVAPIKRTAVVPLDYFLLPEHLDGRQGRNRSPAQPFIEATDDLAALNAWLALYQTNAHTARSYRREAERLLLWSILQQNKALSDLEVVDLAAYRHFLQDPQPATTWCGPPQHKSHPQWKPFNGPLSPHSSQQAAIILSSLFDFLVQQRYLQHNPWTLLPHIQIPTRPSGIGLQRVFNATHWQCITTQLDLQTQQATGRALQTSLRLQIILHLAYATGLRLQELVQLTLGDILTIHPNNATPQQWLNVIGKGQKRRYVPIPPATWHLIQAHYQRLTGQTIQQQPPYYPLIPALNDPRTALTPFALHKTLKNFFTELAKQHAADASLSAHLAKASAHWLRHTHGTVAVAKGIPLTLVRDNLGHASLTTTSQYLHSDSEARYDAFKNINETF